MRSIGRTLLAFVVSMYAAPALGGGAVPVRLYPPDGPRPESDLGELSGMLQAALLRAGARGGDWIAPGVKTAARCGPAARAPARCLARTAEDGIVLLAVAGEGDPAPVDVRAVDGAGRVFGPLRVQVDFTIQRMDGLTAAIQRLEALASAAAARPALPPVPVAAAPAPAAKVPDLARSAAPATSAAPARAEAVKAAPPPAPRAARPGPVGSPLPQRGHAVAAAPAARTAPRASDSAAEARAPAPIEAPAAQEHPEGGLPALTWVLELGGDRGTRPLYRLAYVDGSKQVVEGNTGVFGSAGIAFLPLWKGRLRTRATLGVKYTGQRAKNGSVDATSFPLEVLETAELGQVRIGAGLYAALGQRLSGHGVAASTTARLGSAPGVEARVEWLLHRKLGVGLRCLWSRISGPAGAIGAPAYGLVLSATGG